MTTPTPLFLKIAREINISEKHVASVIALHNDSCTIPFIARYRREKTGNLDEVAIAEIISAYTREEILKERKTAILASLEEQTISDIAIIRAIKQAETLRDLEDLYAPFKRKRKTAATVAREAGLEPLAKTIISQRYNEKEALHTAQQFATKELTAREAVDGAITILAEDISYNPLIRKHARHALYQGAIISTIKRGVTSPDSRYQDYFDFTESFSRIAAHRLLAMLRGEKEGFLSLKPELNNTQKSLESLERTHFSFHTFFTEIATERAWKKHLKPSLYRELIKEAEAQAHITSAQLFFKNFDALLMAPFLGQQSVIAIDPGIRTGCKAVLLASDGTPTGEKVLYLNRDEKEALKLTEWLTDDSVTAIAVGRGTFGRETITLLKKHLSKDILPPVISVSEDGASVYSASQIARDEFPNMDISFRGAVSIGRRLQDPLSELVKIEPASLGVGQYQHDIPTKLLHETLDKCLHWVVNRVGVNLNSASEYLLAQVSGLDARKAKNIVAYRKKNGNFSLREKLKKVGGIGEMSFMMAAGFLLIDNALEPLDRTGVHPEDYQNLYKAARLLNTDISNIIATPALLDSEILSPISFTDKRSLKRELTRQGRDVRSSIDLQTESFTLTSIDALSEGMIIPGIVDNVTAFGAFIDIGLKEKGLVHISELSNTFVKDIHTVVSVGQRVQVKVMSVDKTRRRLSLSIKRVHTDGKK